MAKKKTDGPGPGSVDQAPAPADGRVEIELLREVRGAGRPGDRIRVSQDRAQRWIASEPPLAKSTAGPPAPVAAGGEEASSTGSHDEQAD